MKRNQLFVVSCIVGVAMMLAACNKKNVQATIENPIPEVTIEEEKEVSPEMDASDFVILSEAVPDVILEVRYYSTYNFVGKRVNGYEQPIVLITKEAAAALQQVSDAVKADGYRLKIYDAYRPQRAVSHFLRAAFAEHGPGDGVGFGDQ